MNVHEQAARERKALALVHVLEAEGIDAATARRMTAPQWRALARGQGIHPPSATTVEVVVQMLARGARTRARAAAMADPFADLTPN